MLFSKSLLLLSAVGLSVAEVDVGGPHGNFAPAKRHVNSDAVPPRFEARSNGFERRVKKRGTGKCNTSQGSSSTPTASADSGYASPEAGYMGDSGSASASAAPSSAAPSNPVADNEAGYAAAAQQSGSSESSDSSSGNIVSDVLDGITGFLGDNTGIGSWCVLHASFWCSLFLMLGSYIGSEPTTATTTLTVGKLHSSAPQF